MPRKKPEQLSLEIEENIIEADYTSQMKKNYLDYSMSVIVSRAVPDIRDGLKPVQRRILYDMSELGTASDKPYRKSARIVGDTMGKFHPHGDSSIYGAMTVMAQPFKGNVPLVDGHGNFGSIEGDGAAAMRYTEARLTAFAEDVYLNNLKEDTIDLIPNFDATENEASVLPCKVPMALVNGAEGIAVGMTTSIPPHNLGETIDAALYFGEHPEASTLELMNILKGPDFPTGGIVANESELLNVYETGEGRIRIRGKVEMEKQKSGRMALVITEIPYTMVGQGIEKFLLDVANLVENHTLPEIADISNQSSKDGIRLVLELKRGSEEEAERIKNILYKKTRLEDTFPVTNLVISDGKPGIMSLKNMLDAFWDFQYEITTRKTQFNLNKYRNREEIVDGLIQATDVIDTIIAVLRGSNSVAQAKNCLMTGNTEGIKIKTKTALSQAKKFCFTEPQATAILEMRLSKLIGLELKALMGEQKDLKKKIAHLEQILSDDTVMFGEIAGELKEIREKYATPRKTLITEQQPTVIEVVEEPEMDVVILMDRFSYLHTVDRSTYDKNKEACDAEFKTVIETTNKRKVVCFTNVGRMYSLKVADIPAGKMRDKGQPLDNLCGYDSKNESLIGVFEISEKAPALVFITNDGFAKVVEMPQFDISRKMSDATKLNEGSEVLAVFMYNEKQQVILHSVDGLFARIDQSEITKKLRGSIGSVLMVLAESDKLDMAVPVTGASGTFEYGGKEFSADRIKLQKRRTKGVKARL